jgi:hypothetical protein
MIRALPRFAGVLSLFGVVGLASLVACSEEGTQTPAPAPVADPADTATVAPPEGPLPAGAQKLGDFEAHFNATTKELTFRPIGQPQLDAGALPGPSTQGFAQVASGLLDVTTNVAAVGPTASFNGGPGCPANRLCAIVQVANTSAGRQIDNVFVQVTSVSPSGFVGLNSAAVPTGYPLDNSLGLWSYGGLVAAGGLQERRWDFALPTGADFTFNVALYGTFLRSDYGVGVGTVAAAANTLDNSGTFRNACKSPIVQVPGSPFLVNASPGDDNLGNEIAFPFPFSLYDLTFDTDNNPYLAINTNGMLGYFPPGNDPNRSLPDLTGSLDYSIFPFWDQITVGPQGVCVGAEGTAPNRKFVVTWPDAALSTGGKLIFSAVFSEVSDRIEFQYNRWSSSTTNCAATGTSSPFLGASATVGVQGPGGVATQTSFNTAFLPSHPPACPGPGYTVSFVPTPGNP